MAFPSIPTVAGTRVLSNVQANTTATRTFPSLTGLTKNAGDLLIAICVVYQSSAAANAVFSGWTAGWTEFADRGGTTANMSIGMAYKWSTGSETGTIAVTQAATITGHACMFLLSISGAHATSPPEAGTIAHGTTAEAAIPAFSPSWGAEDTLWIMVGGSGETGTAGAYQGFTTGDPTNYTDNAITGISGDVVGGVEGKVAFRQNNTATETPPTFSPDTSNARNSGLLVAVRPAPPPPLPPPLRLPRVESFAAMQRAVR